MGVGNGVARIRGLLWVFIHDTDKVKGGLMVLFFSLVFSVGPLSWKFFCRRRCVKQAAFIKP